MRILGLTCFCGVALIVVGLLVGKPPVGIEGAYFNRSIGASAFAGAFSQSGTGLLDPSDGNLWIGAGIAVLIVTGLALLFAKRRPDATLPD